MEREPRLGRGRRLVRWQWTVVILLLTIGTIDYLDRSTLSIANPLIRGDLNLNVAQMGWLLSAFSWSYAFANLVAGPAVDRGGSKRLLALGVVVWSVAQLVTGTVVNYLEFIILRVLLGVGEAPFFPGGTRACSEWFSERRRPLAIGAFVSCSALGPAIAAPLLTALMLAIGWRGMFALMGVAGLIMAGVWWFVYRRPTEVALSDAERATLGAEKAAYREREQFGVGNWVRLFRFTTTWGMILGYFGVVYQTYIYLTWLPGYLEIQRHVDISATGWLSAIPYFGGFIGYVSGGVVAAGFRRLGMSPTSGVKYSIVLGLVGAAVFTVPAALVSSTGAAVACIAFAEFFVGVAAGQGWAFAAALAPHKYVATLGSIQNFGGYLGGALAPAVTGMIVSATGSFVPALILAAVIALASAIAYIVIARRPIDQTRVDVAEAA